MKWGRGAAAALLVAACGHKPAPPPQTPEEVIASASPGTTVTVQGTVFTTTYDDTPTGQGGVTVPAGDRWVLIRTAVPAGVTIENLDPNAIDAAWALGLHLTAEQVVDPTFGLPQIGDVVKATGTFNRCAWQGRTEPSVEDITQLTVVSGATPLAKVGDPCNVDMDCRDELICDRASATCAQTPEPILWASAWHDVNGACDTDADCPRGQACDLTYSIQSTGTYAARYMTPGDFGRHLCVPAPGQTRDTLCPRIASTADLEGGRYVQGKEICVRAVVHLSVVANDGDTHNQLVLNEPLPYPATIPVSYAIFGTTTENSPPYKDPARPSGALPDMTAAQLLVVTGTYRFDDGHGWFEIHPYKAWWAGK